MTDPETLYRIYNPHRNGIHGMELSFAHKALREVREALEHGQDFKTDVAERELANCLNEAERIQRIIAKLRAA